MAEFVCIGSGLTLFTPSLLLLAEYYTAFTSPPNNRASTDTLIMGAIPNRGGQLSRSLMI